MKTKKILSLILAAALVVCLAACGGGKTETPANNTPAANSGTANTPANNATEPNNGGAAETNAPETTTVVPPKSTMVAASQLPGGLYVTYISAWAQIMMEEFEGLTIDQEAGGSSQNIMLIEDGQCDFGITTAATAYQGWWGQDWADGHEYQSIRAICPIYDATLAIFTRPNSGISSMKDFEGKAIAAGPSGSLSHVLALQLIDLFDLKNVTVTNMAWADAGDAINDGTVQAVLYMAGHPVGFAQELEVSGDLNIFSFTPEELAKIKEAYPYYADFTLKAGTYKNATSDIQTITAFNMLICDPELPDDFVYRICELTYANNERLAEANAAFIKTSPEYLDAVSIPYHPGAQKWIADNGYTLPEVPAGPAA